jgi:hypothetical protein
MKKDELVPIAKEYITPVPLEVLSTFRPGLPKQTALAERFRILHNFVQIDAAVRYAILVLIKAGYSINNEFSCSYHPPYLNQNPRCTGYQNSFYDEDDPTPYWYEIQISPFKKEHHKRSLLLTVEQLGFTIGELHLWLETQFNRMTQLETTIYEENENLYYAFSKKYMLEHPKASKGNDDFEAWCQYCYKNAPAEYWKHKKKSGYVLDSKGEAVKDIHGQLVPNTDWTTFWTNDWYNWRDYLPFYFMKSAGGLGTEWQGRSIYAEYVIPLRNEVWFFECHAGYYVPYLFVNPFLNLAQTKYILTEEVKKFISFNPSFMPKIPELEAKPPSSSIKEVEEES